MFSFGGSGGKAPGFNSGGGLTSKGNLGGGGKGLEGGFQGVFGGGGKLFDQGRDAFEGIAGLSRNKVGGFDPSQFFQGGPQQSGFRQGQADLQSMLQRQASGQAPSIADIVAQQQRGQAQNAILANLATQRGISPGLAFRNSQNAMAQQNVGLGQQAQVGRLQEQLQAQAALSQFLQGARGQDQAFQQLNQQNNLAQSDAKLQEALQRRDLQSQNTIAENQGRQAQLSSSREGIRSMVSGFGGGMAMSDRRVKKDVRNTSSVSKSFLDHLQATTYKYKNKKHGEGRQFSVMAQDLEKSPVGKAMVIETPEGKAVDYGKGFGAMLAAQVELNRRLKKIEKKGK